MKSHTSEDTAHADKPAPIDKGKVAKPFHTPSRRFKDGDDVVRADLAGTPLDFDHMVNRGFIASVPT